MSVSRLAYIGAHASDLAAWKTFGTEVLGFQLGPDSGDRLLYLRADQRHHRLSIHPGESDDIAFVGWEVANHDALESAAAGLERHGVKVTAGTPRDLADRRVIELVHFSCPYTGVRMELTVGPEMIFDPPFHPTRALSGFRTDDLGLGHFVLYVDDPVIAAEFYVATLGFGLSDWLISPEREKLAAFLHCNPRHHSMAFIKRPGAARKVQHVFFETRSIDDVGRTYEVCLQRELAKTSIGRHPNDRSISFYFKNPSRWFIEYGWDLLTIDRDRWTVENYILLPGLAWGHVGLRSLEDPEAPALRS